MNDQNDSGPNRLFISHASEDKSPFVSELAEILTKYGVNVWYDEYDIKIGDSISRKIDEGLSNSKYGLLVLSEKFFTKYWTKEELGGIRSLNASGQLEKLVPIWLNVEYATIAKNSPILADKMAIVSNGSNIHSVALQVIEATFPEILQNSISRHTLREATKDAEVQMVSTEKLIFGGPVRHKFFSANFIVRATLVHEIVGIMSFEDFMDSFSRDVNPHAELVWWEFYAYFYTGLCNAFEGTSIDRNKLKNDIFECLNGAGPIKLIEENENVSNSDDALIFMAKMVEFHKQFFDQAMDENRRITVAMSDF